MAEFTTATQMLAHKLLYFMTDNRQPTLIKKPGDFVCETEPQVRLAVDIGGTCTDIVPGRRSGSKMDAQGY